MRNKEIFRKDQPLQEGLYWMKWRRKDSSFHEFKEQVLLYKECSRAIAPVISAALQLEQQHHMIVLSYDDGWKQNVWKHRSDSVYLQRRSKSLQNAWNINQHAWAEALLWRNRVTDQQRGRINRRRTRMEVKKIYSLWHWTEQTS